MIPWGRRGGFLQQRRARRRMLLQDVSVCIVLVYYVDIDACMHAIAEGKKNVATKHTQIRSYYAPIISRAMPGCIDSADSNTGPDGARCRMNPNSGVRVASHGNTGHVWTHSFSSTSFSPSIVRMTLGTAAPGGSEEARIGRERGV